MTIAQKNAISYNIQFKKYESFIAFIMADKVRSYCYESWLKNYHKNDNRYTNRGWKERLFLSSFDLWGLYNRFIFDKGFKYHY